MEEFDDVARARATCNQFVKALHAGREILQRAAVRIHRAFGTLKQ
jgi:hypothetical protein